MLVMGDNIGGSRSHNTGSCMAPAGRVENVGKVLEYLFPNKLVEGVMTLKLQFTFFYQHAGGGCVEGRPTIK